jgi:GTP-binding protein
VAPPTYGFFTNVAKTYHFTYQRYLENRLREEFGFEGTPLRLHVRAKRAKAGKSEGSERKKR